MYLHLMLAHKMLIITLYNLLAGAKH